MAAKYKAKGTLLQTKVSATFTTIANRVQIKPPAPEVTFAETQDLDSTYVEKDPVIVNLGTVSLTAFFDPSDTLTLALRTEALTPPATPREYKVVYPDAMTTPANDTFSAFVKTFQPTGIERDKFMQYELELEVTDAMAFNAGVA